MSTEKFKLPNSSFDEIVKIIKSYGHFNKPTSLDQVSKLIGMDPTVISRNVGFLVEIGILESGQKKALTANGSKLAQALEHGIQDEIDSCWRAVVGDNEFLSKIVSAIRIRNGMDESTLQSHIAFSAGQPKKPQFMTGARSVVEVLRASSLVGLSDGKYVVSDIHGNSVPTKNSEVPEPPSSTNPSSTLLEIPKSVKLDSGSSMGACVQLRVNINISCTPEELDSLGEKLRTLVEEFEKSDQE